MGLRSCQCDIRVLRIASTVRCRGSGSQAEKEACWPGLVTAVAGVWRKTGEAQTGL